MTYIELSRAVDLMFMAGNLALAVWMFRGPKPEKPFGFMNVFLAGACFHSFVSSLR